MAYNLEQWMQSIQRDMGNAEQRKHYKKEVTCLSDYFIMKDFLCLPLHSLFQGTSVSCQLNMDRNFGYKLG